MEILDWVDNEIRLSRTWINNCIMRSAINLQTDLTKVTPLRQYTLDEFRNGTINNSKMDNEPLVDWWERTSNFLKVENK